MAKKTVTMAIAYDFDGTLAPGNMQEYDFVPKVGMTTADFWKETSSETVKHNADRILIYMKQMLDKAQAARVSVRRENFVDYGRSVRLFAGVTDWFRRINDYGKSKNIIVEHYIISSGIKEMIEGTPIADEFKAIYASSFVYDHNGIAVWPALAVNYTTKTQFLFRINKGVLNVYDDHKVNEYLPQDERPVPFENMIFVGDGETDIPCFRLVKEQNGHSIAVFPPKKKGAKARTDKLIAEGRVNFACAADYSAGSSIEITVKAVIDKIAADSALKALGKIP
ncbi:haloacid dehalogenase-like hydrolase [Geovibrio thiophilus]|uniref:Haloacid dehalogenase-like hydrolase n=1 Tax=Geovibrio thiophilus TaxID=139438 RepID=A0A410JV83_9BACT|nr:HAD family hydrolase [Geovibrio thiophilus]QAR32120.1 haloacid dehalogenase-like hydrolase [Geovibrio thiophilus]